MTACSFSTFGCLFPYFIRSTEYKGRDARAKNSRSRTNVKKDGSPVSRIEGCAAPALFECLRYFKKWTPFAG